MGFFSIVTWISGFLFGPAKGNESLTDKAEGSGIGKDGKLDQTFETIWPNDLGFDTVREERNPIVLPVQGKIPRYAAGTIYRNGPGARELRDSNGELKYSCSHWFDGFGQLHRFQLVPGDESISHVRYSSRFNVDSLMEDLTRTGFYDGYTFGQKRDPCMTIFRKVMCLFTAVPEATPTNCNVPVTVSANPTGFPEKNIMPSDKKSGHKSRGHHLIARTDEGHIKAIDAQTLEPIGVAHQQDLHPLLKGPLSASHAKSDPEDGDVFNYNLDLGYETIYRVFRTSAETGDTEILATISAPEVKAAYMHSFFLTENFVILCVWSAHLVAGGMKVLWKKNILDAISPFDASGATKWFVIDRRHSQGVVATFESPAAFCFHTVNAFEVVSPSGGDEVDIACDLIEYENLEVLNKFYYTNLLSSSAAAAKWTRETQPKCNEHYARYMLRRVPCSSSNQPLSRTQRESKRPLPKPRQAEKTATIRSPIAGEIPTINLHRATRPYRYFWNCTFSSGKSSFVDGLCKVDIETGEGIRWNNPQGHSPGEALFVPNPDGKEEDDGVLLTVVLDGFNKTSYVLCLDAKTMTELGRADCAGPLAFTFHGQHVKDDDVFANRPVDV